MKLSMVTRYMNSEKAVKIIHAICKDLGAPIPKKANLQKTTITITSGENQSVINIADELNSLKETGQAKSLQYHYDSRDQFLNKPMELGIYLDGGKGLKFRATENFGSSTEKIFNSGSFEAPQTSLSSDIEKSRVLAIQSFNERKYADFNHFYRSYLFASISLIDCFLHRYSFFLKEKVQDYGQFDNINTLLSRGPLEDRIEAWIMTFATGKMDNLKSTVYWSNFKELKNKRNEIVHPTKPLISYEVKSMVKVFNLAKGGVGGFLGELRAYAEHRPHIGFIESMRNLPEIRISDR